ncbi:MAG TPA: alpha/beta hydrolase-fold protein [Candidatus Didemnitutus sp.]|nr:alpha/beta hydrolase-fold protein [Candidatus Didemnitutus sp.]
MPAPAKTRTPLGTWLTRWWQSEPAVKIDVIDDFAWPKGLTPRPITLYSSTRSSRGPARPLLVALDGQTMPQWELAATLDNLATGPQPIFPVVAAIPASADRLEEYGTAGIPDFAGRGKRARAFQDFLVSGVIPAIRARTHAGRTREGIGIFGASMGGLGALDTAWNHPAVFGFAGIFSGSLWWRSDDSSPAARQSSRIMLGRIRATTPRPDLRLWFEAGTADEKDDRDGNGVIDAIQDTTELIDAMVERGFRRGVDVVYRQVEGGEHNERTWAGVLPEFLRWGCAARLGGGTRLRVEC